MNRVVLMQNQEFGGRVQAGGGVTAVAQSAGGWSAAGRSSGGAFVADSRSGEVIWSWRAHQARVTALAAHEEHCLLSASKVV